MWQQITESLNPEAQAFLKLWDKAMWLAGQPPIAEEAIAVLDWMTDGVLSFEKINVLLTSPWNDQQMAFCKLLSVGELDAYRQMIKEGVTI